MERRTIKITAAAIITGILSVVTAFAIYYFTGTMEAMILFTLAASLILSHIFLEISLTYETGFLYSLFTMILSTGFVALIYFNLTNGLFFYQKEIHAVIYLNWLVPMIYYIFRCLFDKGPRFVSFTTYFFKASILFSVYYVCNFIYHTFLDPIAMPYAFRTNSNSFIPFFNTATHIEDFIYMGTGIGELFLYIGKIFILFMPIGFYASLILRDYSKKTAFRVKTVLCIFVPVIFEAISFLQGNVINIDSYLYRFLGIFFGILLLKLLDAIFFSITREKFLIERNRYSFFL